MANSHVPEVDPGGGDYPEYLYRSTKRAELVADLDAVSEVEISFYRENGYLAIGSALHPDQVNAALDGLESLVLDHRGATIQFEAWAADRLEQLDGPARLDAVRKFIRFVDYEPRLKALAYDERLLSVVRRLVETDDIELWQDMALLKPPGGGREKPWHQDNAFFALTPGTRVVGVWIALDKATPENGCMHIIPGSHREGPVVHFRRRDWQICDTDVQIRRDVVVPLPPGGLLFFDALLHHGTPANRTDLRRRALQFHYVPSTVDRISREERLAIFGSEGKDVTC